MASISYCHITKGGHSSKITHECIISLIYNYAIISAFVHCCCKPTTHCNKSCDSVDLLEQLYLCCKLSLWSPW